MKRRGKHNIYVDTGRRWGSVFKLCKSNINAKGVINNVAVRRTWAPWGGDDVIPIPGVIPARSVLPTHPPPVVVGRPSLAPYSRSFLHPVLFSRSGGAYARALLVAPQPGWSSTRTRREILGARTTGRGRRIFDPRANANGTNPTSSHRYTNRVRRISRPAPRIGAHDLFYRSGCRVYAPIKRIFLFIFLLFLLLFQYSIPHRCIYICIVYPDIRNRIYCILIYRRKEIN